MADDDLDPDQVREIERAVRWWTQYLTGRVLPGIDPAHAARTGVEAMVAERWRVPLRPVPRWHPSSQGPPGAPGQEYRKLRREQGHPMLCEPCRTDDHDECRGATWCDCEHGPTPTSRATSREDRQ